MLLVSATLQHESSQIYICLCLLSFPITSHPIPPFRLSHNTRFELPASYSKFPLAILHMIMYMFPSYSQFVPPLFPPPCPKVCSLCLRYCAANRFIWSNFPSSVQFSCSVMSNNLQPHRLQHARPSCPSPTPGVYSNCVH